MPTKQLTTTLSKVHDWRTLRCVGRRIPLLFPQPSQFLIRVTSRIGESKNWIRAGVLAQVLVGLPGDPKKDTKRLYLDENFERFDGSGYSYYLEFWPYRWLSDYRLEVWAQLQPTLVVFAVQPFTINGETFTIDGVELRL
ncbi:hypothetical protein [cf. Phormidesmis sp. LEGE 11477]|uniref:hypothetical protein n=1 Tax=cf. Phormidesmis sp. LEGE 11477 TaxID=1828680 RepID=UPI00187EC9B3|nr:hypothetical protein [cf. Phormidesmis sp. LEGE 11477]MBE9064147.1 hypothetical protein [cf. Phormidesmis sp. LEGE 11477]